MEELQTENDVNYVISWIAKHEKTVFIYFINIATSIIVMILGVRTVKYFSILVNKISVYKYIDETISGFLTTLLRYIILVSAVVAFINCMGTKATSIIAVLGAAGVTAGFALQRILSHFASGALLVTLRPFKTGEYVNLCKMSGTVLHVHVFYTMLRTLDGKIIVVPNNKIFNENIINYSREPARRNEFFIHIPYNTNVDVVIDILKEVALNEPKVLKERGVVVGLSELGSSSMIFIVRCWSRTEDINIVYWDLMLKFKKSLDKNKIASPTPQLEVSIKNKKNKFFNDL